MIRYIPCTFIITPISPIDLAKHPRDSIELCAWHIKWLISIHKPSLKAMCFLIIPPILSRTSRYVEVLMIHSGVSHYTCNMRGRGQGKTRAEERRERGKTLRRFPQDPQTSPSRLGISTSVAVSNFSFQHARIKLPANSLFISGNSSLACFLLFSHLGNKCFPRHNLVDTATQGKDLSFRAIQPFPLLPPERVAGVVSW